MTSIKIISFFVSLLLLTSRIIAQSSILKFDQIGPEQGLSQSTVNTIVQDVQGFMWFGTQDGLNRYDGYSFTVFKNNPDDSNSISNNSILSLFCDSRGDLWIGTERGGLNRYVSSENKFYHYKHQDGDTTTLSENHVKTIFEDSRNNIWVGTQRGGLNLLNRTAGTFKSFLIDKGNISSHRACTIYKICEDNFGYIWVATALGLYKLNLNELNSNSNDLKFIQYFHIPSNPNSLSGNIFTLYCDKKGKLWIGTWGAGLNCFDEKSGTLIKYLHNAKKPGSLSGNMITSVYEDSEGLLWIGTYDGGLDLINSKTNSFDKNLNESIISLYEDRSGIMWIGIFAGGIKVFDRRKNNFVHFYDDSKKLNHLHGNQVFTILMDRDNELWVGTWNDGLNRIDQQRRNITYYHFNPANNHSLGSDRVYTLCESSDGRIWVGTMSGGLNCFDKKTNKFTRFKHDSKYSNTICSNDVSALYYDKHLDILWIGYYTGGVSCYNLSKNKFTHFMPDDKNVNAISGGAITVIYKGDKSGMWIGTFDQGVNRFISQSNSFKHYKVSPEFIHSSMPGRQSIVTSTSVNNDGIFSIYEDYEGIVWIGTYGGGLNRYNSETNSFTFYNTRNGFPNNIIYGILPDKLGYLWLSTNKGLIKFNPKTKKFKNFDVSDGLQSNEFNQGAYFLSSKGEMFFGGINGFNSFSPEKIEENSYIPPVYLTGFKVLNELLILPDPIPKNATIELSYSQNIFSFEFVALNYTSSEKNQYAYKLEGFDNDWHKVSAQQRYASYTNLDPGKYYLHIIGSNNDGIWNETGTAATIIIKPPYWMTWWFKCLGIFFFFSLVLFFYRRRINSLKKEKNKQQEISRLLIEKQEEERKRIAQGMHDSLGQELLFIKNHAQVSLKNSSLDTAACEHLNQISDATSGVLKTVREISHNLRPPELDRLGLAETIRSMILSLRESTSIIANAEIECIDGLIPHELEINIVRIIQEAIGNIIKHSQANECTIIAVPENNEVHLEINDNGIGFDYNKIIMAAHSFGIGLTGMTERVRILGGSIEIKSSPSKGTHIKIRIPSANNKRK